MESRTTRRVSRRTDRSTCSGSSGHACRCHPARRVRTWGTCRRSGRPAPHRPEPDGGCPRHGRFHRWWSGWKRAAEIGFRERRHVLRHAEFLRCFIEGRQRGAQLRVQIVVRFRARLRAYQNPPSEQKKICRRIPRYDCTWIIWATCFSCAAIAVEGKRLSSMSSLWQARTPVLTRRSCCEKACHWQPAPEIRRSRWLTNY